MNKSSYFLSDSFKGVLTYQILPPAPAKNKVLFVHFGGVCVQVCVPRAALQQSAELIANPALEILLVPVRSNYCINDKELSSEPGPSTWGEPKDG